MKTFIDNMHMTVKEFAKMYDIPYNTARQWYNGQRKCPEYIKKLINRTANGKQLKIKIKKIKEEKI